jgi:hypothetical protein
MDKAIKILESVDCKTTMNYDDTSDQEVYYRYEDVLKAINKALTIPVVSNCSIYGFKVGTMVIEESGQTEREALINFVNNYWDLINKNERIELMGKMTTV